MQSTDGGNSYTGILYLNNNALGERTLHKYPSEFYIWPYQKSTQYKEYADNAIQYSK